MKTLRLKLISMLAMLFLMFGVLTVGIFAVNQQTVTLSGNISFRVEDRSLYVKQVRIKQDNNSEPQPVTAFMPGYINGEFNMNIGDYVNDIGSFALYFDIINTTDIQWTISSVTLAPEIENSVSVSYSGVVYETTLTETDENGDKVFDPEETDINGTLVLIVSAPNSDSIDLSDITITIAEYIEPAVQVTNVQINDSTPDSTTEYNGEIGISEVLDLSNIQFETGETEVVISMTSLNANYIKNNVSWYNTSGVTITSTSLYLPQNPSGEVTGGESRDLKITVTNNSGSPITVSGLEVAFEEKEDLLQATAEGEVSKYTEEGYWYVEMGTYSTTSDNEEGKRESEYLRWRYFAEETTEYVAETDTTSEVLAEGQHYATFDPNTRPEGNGYFILETYIDAFDSTAVNGINVTFNNDVIWSSPYDHQLNGLDGINANDYSTSTIRQYMNSTELVSKSYTSTSTDEGTIYSPSTDLETQSNMFTDLHIDPENDIVYSQIIARTLGDLYSRNYDDHIDGLDSNGNGITFPDLSGADAGYQYQSTDSDKFWLLSYYEAYNLLSGNATTDDDTDREWGGIYWWLRSHYHVSGYSGYTYGVYYDGTLDKFTYVHYIFVAARAAFKLAV